MSLHILGFVIVMYSMASNLMATQTVVPEIDGSSLAAGLGVLAGVTLIMTSRRNRT